MRRAAGRQPAQRPRTGGGYSGGTVDPSYGGPTFYGDSGGSSGGSCGGDSGGGGGGGDC
jgi:hypothetical protein